VHMGAFRTPLPGPPTLSGCGWRQGLERKYSKQFSSLLNTSPMGKAVSGGYPGQELKGCANYKSKLSPSVHWLNINKMQIA